MAVPMETDDTAGFAEDGARESACLVLADEKFLEEKGAWSECESFFAVRAPEQRGILIAEGKDGGWLDADEWGVVGDDGMQERDIARGAVPCES
jgi:hypothetical protein